MNGHRELTSDTKDCSVGALLVTAGDRLVGCLVGKLQGRGEDWLLSTLVGSSDGSEEGIVFAEGRQVDCSMGCFTAVSVGN